MRNWSTNTEALEKDPEAFAVWKLEQLINYGLEENERIKEGELRKYWHRIDIDNDRRKFLQLLLGG
mgnify:CR=1 FL=1